MNVEGMIHKNGNTIIIWNYNHQSNNKSFVWITHMHKLAFDVEEMNEEQRKAEHTEGKAFSLIVHTNGTERSYQIEVAPPEGKSYAGEIAQKYGGYL